MRHGEKTILIDGLGDDFRAAKTAMNLIRYDKENIIGLIDSKCREGSIAQDIFGMGGELPIYQSIHDVPHAQQLILGTTPPGGELDSRWRTFIVDAIERGWDIISGLHVFLNKDEEFRRLATQHAVTLHDVRNTDFQKAASRTNIRDDCLRILTVGNDSNVGKMVTSMEIVKDLKYRGKKAKFVATGQTGIMIAGDGLPIDAVKADFINGAAEYLVKKNQHHDIIIIEGQGGITNPMFSAVTLGLLHGSMPDGLVFCYEAGRKKYRHMDIEIPSIPHLILLYENMASVNHPCQVIAIAMNSRALTDLEAKHERQTVEKTTRLPVVDVIRDGDASVLSEAILKLQKK